MWTRTTNPSRENYARYGGRGIRVCDRWRSFDTFLADMGPKPSSGHSLDRIDPDGNYEPANCRWASSKFQARNKRNSRVVQFNGESITVAELSERSGVSPFTLYDRLRRGCAHDMLLEPQV